MKNRNIPLTEEKSTWQFLADGLTQEHQQNIKLDLLGKVSNIQWQIDEIKRMKAKRLSEEKSNCNIPHVINPDCKCKDSTWDEDAGCFICDDCNERI